MKHAAHLRIADVRVRIGTCDRAMPHIAFARTVYPSSAPVRAVSLQCDQARVNNQKGAQS